MKRLTGLLVIITGLLLIQSSRPNAYATYSSWPTNSVTYYVNPNNLYVTNSAAIADLQAAASAWHDQTSANIQLIYGGTTTQTVAQLDYKNNVMFNTGAAPSCTYCGALTYYWFDANNHLLDADTVIYEANYTYFTGNAGCSGYGMYIQDSTTHEFGHMLGMAHSTVTTATMYPSTSYCDTSWESLDPDDIKGIQSLYPPAAAAPSAPTGLSVAVNASSPTSSLSTAWLDTATNATGYRVERSTDGATFAQIAQLGSSATAFTDTGLSAGTTYYYRVDAFNGSGTSAYSNVASGITQVVVATASSPSAPSNPSPANGATGVSTNVTLSWSCSGAQSYDVYINGSLYAANLTTASASVGSLANSTMYSWSVVAKNSVGSTAGPTWSFTTKSTKTHANNRTKP